MMEPLAPVEQCHAPIVAERDLRQEWETPDDFWRVIDGGFKFQKDAAASEENAKCALYLRKHDPSRDDALMCSWDDSPWTQPCTRIYCNPGFANLMPWAVKAHQEARKHPSAVVCLMGLLSAAEWFWYCAKNATEIRILSPRVQFVPAPGVKASSNAKDNVLVVFRRKVTLQPAQIFVWNWRERAGE